MQADLKEQVQAAAAGVPEAAQDKAPARLAADAKAYEAQCGKAFHAQRFLEEQWATAGGTADGYVSVYVSRCAWQRKLRGLLGWLLTPKRMKRNAFLRRSGPLPALQQMGGLVRHSGFSHK